MPNTLSGHSVCILSCILQDSARAAMHRNAETDTSQRSMAFI